MENQRPAKRRHEEDEDRISELPQHILQNHVLSLLSQKKAVRTCILSKSWRHLGPTRPKIEFDESSFPENEEKFLSIVENTLKRCDDQNLSIQEFILDKLWSVCGSSCSCSLLKKWTVKLHMLKRLSLHSVCVDQETFDKVLSSCPLIQHLVLNDCRGLSSVKVNKAPKLKHFDCEFVEEKGSIEINDDAPSLETIRIKGVCETNWHLYKNNYFLPRLKSLDLDRVHLPTEFLNNLSSNNCPCLEELELHDCSGFTEFKLSNRSIKRLVINFSDPNPIEVAIIDAPNMLNFEFGNCDCLPSLSFATTSRECKSCIELWFSPDFHAHVSSSTWYLKLYEFLKALSQSQISLGMPNLHYLTNQDSTYGGISEPAVVEDLYLKEFFPSSEVPEILNCVFRICRPRYIQDNMFSQLRESKLLKKAETSQCHFWQQDLEESSIQVSDNKTKEWRDVQECEFLNNEEIRFRLKWRDFS